MTFACVVEGHAEFNCIPSLLGRRGHTVIGRLTLNGGNGKSLWAALIRNKVFPRVRGMALKRPDKVLVVLDREDRSDCCPTLASTAAAILQQALAAENIVCCLSIVVCDRNFENALFADVQLVDRLAIIAPQHKFSTSVPASLDGVNVLARLKSCLAPGQCYDKVRHSLALIRELDYNDAQVLQRSRCLQKLIKESS